MTCAVGVCTRAGVVIAADSRTFYEGMGHVQDTKESKVFRPRRWLAWTFAGDYEVREALLRAKWPKQPSTPSLAWVVTSVSPLIPTKCESDVMLGVVGRNGSSRLFVITAGMAGVHDCAAIGEGEQAALGAYRALRRALPGMVARDLAREAVRASSKVMPSVGGRISVVTLKSGGE